LLTAADSERTKLFVLTETEVRADKNSLDSVQDQIFEYLREKVPKLPADLFEQQSFDHESGLLSAERIKSENLDLWAAKFTEPDSTIAGRSWSLEITLGQHAKGANFGSRLSCFSRRLDFEFEAAVPRLFKDLAGDGHLLGDGIRLTRAPTDIQTDEEVSWLVALINNKRRWRNVIVLSSDESGICKINPYILADRICAVGHVVRIFPDAAFRLSDTIGKFYSVFDNGIRVYRPTSRVEIDNPGTHPLFTRSQLDRFDLKRLQNTIALDTFRASVERNVVRQSVPTFAQVRAANATFRLTKAQEAGSTVNEQLQAALAAKTAAEAQAQEALALAVQEEGARITAEEERNQEKARAAAIYARVQVLERQLKAAALEEEAEDDPTTYDEIAAWVEARFAGRMRLLSRALRGLKEAEFEDIGLVCALLRLLAISYVDSKRGVENAWQDFEDGLKQRNVDISKSISDNRAGQEGEEYYVKYKNQKQLLEWHLKKGTSRNVARSLRIYFFWDDEDAEVIVGYLPAHLDNRLT
jgi:hypothetical protein